SCVSPPRARKSPVSASVVNTDARANSAPGGRSMLPKKSSVADNGLRFERLVIPYAGSYEDLRHSIEENEAVVDGKSPRFIAYQADVWSQLKPERFEGLRNS